MSKSTPRRIQPHDALLLDVHHWCGSGRADCRGLGLVVGFVVVAQTIYATTMDHVREFGTLKAMGAPNSYVYKVIMKQAAISALMGYVLGMFVSVFVVHASQKGGAAILMPVPMAVGMFFLTLAMCVGAALVSINKVMHLDPAMVFKG